MESDNPNTMTSGWRFSDVQVPHMHVSGIENGTTGADGEKGTVKVYVFFCRSAFYCRFFFLKKIRNLKSFLSPDEFDSQTYSSERHLVLFFNIIIFLLIYYFP